MENFHIIQSHCTMLSKKTTLSQIMILQIIYVIINEFCDLYNS